MFYIDIDSFVKDNESAEYYSLFRHMEDWCLDNLFRDRWRLDYTSTISVCGVDLPRRFIFMYNSDYTAFVKEFRVHE